MLGMVAFRSVRTGLVAFALSSGVSACEEETGGGGLGGSDGSGGSAAETSGSGGATSSSPSSTSAGSGGADGSGGAPTTAASTTSTGSGADPTECLNLCAPHAAMCDDVDCPGICEFEAENAESAAAKGCKQQHDAYLQCYFGECDADCSPYFGQLYQCLN
jgi:hypothetical protein